MVSGFVARSRILGACRRSVAVLLFLLAAPAAHAALTVTPITWDIVGLDSNSPATGPQHFPVGARVCSDVATTVTNVSFAWDPTSANAFIDTRPGSLATIAPFGPLPAGGCADAYFEIEVTQTAAAFDTFRRYAITATDATGTYSTPTPRQIYVEHLVSQSRNSITNLRYGPDEANLVAVAEGGSLDLVVGQTYVIELSGATATQGYEQLEAFINFTNTIFRIIAVETTYSADTSPFVANPSDRLYADACRWENDPNSPNYRSCLADGKAGGTIVTLYTITIVGGGGTQQTLNTLVHDFSGSSFHYNADFGVGARFANIIDPTTATIEKSFNPNPAPLNGVSVLTFTLANPNTGTLPGYNFVDNLPANLVIAATPNATTSGCGTPTLSAPAGGTTISFANGTVLANGTCTIRVNVTPTAVGTLDNTTNNLFIGTTNTGDNASASLTVNNEPPPGTGVCGNTLASWTFNAGFNVTTPAPAVANVTASASAGGGVVPNTQNGVPDGVAATAWGSNGSITPGLPFNTANNEYFEFAIDTTGQTQVSISFDARRTANGPRGVALYYGTSPTPPGTQVFATDLALPTTTAVHFGSPGVPITVTSGLNPSGPTYFRIYFYNSNQVNPGADPALDNVLFTGCGVGIKPTIAKSFSPDPIALNGVSTLTFTLTNPNNAILTDARFTDALPAGVQVAATPAAASTCGPGTWLPTAGATTLSFGTPLGGTIPANGSCTVSVNVTGTTIGTKSNTSGFLSTAETGTTTTSVATDTLTVVAPPSIEKLFAPNPILTNGVSTLTFTVTNPNPDNAIAGVAFTDNLPGVVQVAAAPNATTSGCGAPVFAPAAGATSVTFSGGAIAAAGTCVVTVDVTAATAGSYVNTSGPVSHVVNGTPVDGNTATDTLVVEAPNPAVNLLKQVGASATGPWLSFLAVNPPAGVFYRFTIENVGDVPLGAISLSDDTLNVAGCTWPASLPVADALDDDHIATCVVGPVAAVPGSHVNTATASGTFGPTTVQDIDSATYATAALTIDKSATPATYAAAGEVISYTFLVTNSGFATLAGPITVLDDRTTNETCPALSTVGDLDNFFDPGESLTCTASYTITAGDVTAGSVVNVATATNGTTTSPSDTATVNVTAPVLGTTKAATLDNTVVPPSNQSNPGDTIAYTITVSNTGTSAATSVSVSDPRLPSLSCTIGGGAVSPPVTLNAGASLVCTGTYVLTPGDVATGQVSNTATTTAANVCNPTTTGSACSDTEVTPLAVAPILTTTKAATLDNTVVPPSNQSNPGDTIAYTITVANSGNGAATSVSVSDALLPSLSCTIGGGAVTPPVTLAAGASLVCTGSYTLVQADVSAGSVTNTAVVTGGNVCNPTTAGSTCSDSETTPLALSPVLTMSKAATLDNTVVPPASESNPGDTIAYTLTVTNSGNGSATGVSIADPRVPSLSCTIGGGAVTPPVTLNAGASLVCTGTYTLVQADVTAGSVSNTATVTGGNVCNPTTAGSICSDTENTPLAVAPVLTTTKAATLDNTVAPPSNESNPGDTIAYTITVANSGNGAATGVEVSDPRLPVLSCTIGGGSVSPPVTLAAGASLVCTGTYTLVQADVDAGSVSNTATTTGANVCNPTTSGSTCSDTRVTPLGVVPALTLTKSAVPDNTVVAPANQSNPGDTIAYTITVSNSGNAPANNVVVSDPLLGALACSIGGVGVTPPTALNAGASLVCTGSYTLTAGDVTNGSVANTATVAADNVCNPTTVGSTCSDTETTPLALAAVLATTKSATLDNTVVAPSNQSNPGDRIAYTITVANSGNTAATNVSVTDPLLASLSCTIGGNPATLPTTLDAGATVVCSGTYTLVQADVANGSVVNTATVSGGNVCNPTTAGSTCSDTETTPLALVPVLATTKSATVDNTVVAPSNESNPGDTIAYTITVANTGNGAATGVSIADPLLSSLSCTIGGGSVSPPVTLNAGAALVCTGTYTLVQADVTAGSVSNTATVTGTNVCNPTTAGSTCSDTRVTPLGVVAVLTTTKSAVLDNTVVAPNDQSNPGDRIAYTITVVNSGNAAATNVTVNDPLIASLSCTIGGGPVSLPTTLDAGATLTCTGTHTLSAGNVSNGFVDNTATVTAGNVCNPTTQGSTCSDSESTPLAIRPVLTTTKSAVLDNTVVAPSNQSNPGDRIGYTITVANSGNGIAPSVSVSDPLVPALSCTVGGNPTSLPTSINPGQSLVCTGTYTLTAGDVSNGSVANTATVTGEGVCNPTTAGSTCSDTETTPLAVFPVLAASKVGTLDNTVVAPANESNAGDTIAYTITVANSGNGAATGVSVADARLPSLSCTIGGNPTALPTTLAGGATLVCTGTYTLTGADVTNGSVVNTATVSGSNVCNPTTAGSTCSDTETTPLGQVPNLTVDKSHVGDFTQGQVGAQYTIVVRNVGSGPTAGTVTLADTLPTGLTATAFSGTGWSCTLSPLSCTRSDPLAVGASYPALVLTVDVAANAPGTVVNTATVSGGGDTTPANNSDSDPATVGDAGAPGTPDLMLEKSHTGDLTRGGTATYALRVSNVGPVPTAGTVTVVDALPTGLTATAIGGTGWTCTLATLTCTRGDALASGASYPVITLTATVNADAPSQITNAATVSGGGDSSPPNNTDDDAAPIGFPQPLPVPAGSVWTMLLLAAALLLFARRRFAPATR